ncbi:response regulator [Lichenicoccus roseus]|uniref:Response regulator n=1 Tax=Lichenicoccus roseus TaxID=2683649 RepID=A0A5R9J2E4_9PROT|nr:response regulator [Lichenicoccus roseus]TLU71732.1 response regulator [Lichenicoccus roseus]
MRILIVDDDQLIRENAAEYLSGLGYDVLTAADGSEAARLLDQPDQVQVLLTDVMLQGWLDGGDLVEMARLRVPGMPIVIMSGFSEGLLGRLAGLQPPLRFLSKPFSLAHLEETLARAVAGGAAP